MVKSKTKNFVFTLRNLGNYTNIGETYTEKGTVYINEGSGTLFWWNFLRWKYAIYQLFENRDKFPQLPQNINLNRQIDDIAIVEIKKKNDNKTETYYPEIQYYAKADKEFLKEQILLINPDIIFCGGTFEYLKIIFENKKILSLTNKNKRNFLKFDKRLIIDFYHPSCRKKDEEPYNEICNDLIKYQIFEHFNW